eukprot:1425275-Pleurochrysis_carterae.AAC.1
MKNAAVREEWERFVESHADLFRRYDTIAWRRALRRLEEFLEEQEKERGGKRKPSRKSENVDEKRLADWIYDQQVNYKQHAYIMKDAAIRA